MCGAYALNQIEKLKERFGIGVDAEAYDLMPRYNIRPTQQAPVIVHDGTNELRFMRWGLIPSWAKDTKIGYKMINARAETLDTLPSYKKAFRSQRCLIPANGFYEWMKTARGKVPYHIRLKDEDLIGFAGLYEIWHDADSQALLSYTIITTRPNEVVAPIHDRMPAILPKDQEDLWLDPDFHETDILKALLLTPHPASAMEAYPISPLVNSPKNDTPEILVPTSEQ